MNINVFSWLLSFSKLRERVITKFGCNGKMSQSYLSYFFWRGSTGEFLFFHGLIDFVLFLMLAWRIFGVLRVSVFLSFARSKMAIVRLPPDLLKNSLFLYLLPLRGREPHFRLGSPHQSFGFIFSFPFRCPATQGHLSANICVTHIHF